eukprot:scaffold172228_cov17-Tisochrysis_lutea.AAC.1
MTTSSTHLKILACCALLPAIGLLSSLPRFMPNLTMPIVAAAHRMGRPWYGSGEVKSVNHNMPPCVSECACQVEADVKAFIPYK